jgi:hypothetical protein
MSEIGSSLGTLAPRKSDALDKDLRFHPKYRAAALGTLAPQSGPEMSD